MRIKTATVFFTIICFACFSSASGQMYTEDGSMYKKERRAWMAKYRGNYEKAIRCFDRLIEEKPREAIYRQERAECFKKLKKYDRAIQEYRSMTDNFPPDHKNYIEIYNIERTRGNKKEALDAINLGIEMLDDPNLYEFRGKLYFKAHDLEKAGEDFRMAYNKARSQNLDVTDHGFYSGLADELASVLDYDNALQAIDYALEKLEHSPPLEVFGRDYNPDFRRNYLIKKAEILGLSGQYSEALDVSSNIALDGSDGKIRGVVMMQRGLIMMMAGNYSDALANFRRSRSVSSVGTYIPDLQWECLYQMEDYPSCLRVLEQWSSSSGKGSSLPGAYILLLQTKQNKDPGVINEVNRLIASHPEEPELHFIRARILALLEQKNEAVASFKQAVNEGFLDPYKIKLGMMDLQPVFTSEEDRALLARLNIDLPQAAIPFKERVGLIHCDPYLGDEERLALVIGNGMYEHGGILSNPENDANDMAAVLEHLGFDVMKYENAGQNAMKRAIDEFGYRLRLYDVGLFFYAGHGIQVNGVNYLIPVDADIRNEMDVEFTCVDAGRALARMEDAGNRINIIILDACRDNPFERSWTRSSRGRGLARMDAPTGSIIAYSTEPGNTASDGPGRNGLYTEVLLGEMQKPGVIIERLFRQVRTQVIDRSGEKQVPWESTSLTGDFRFLDE